MRQHHRRTRRRLLTQIAVIALLVTGIVGVGQTTATAATTRTVADCAQNLDCDLGDFNAWSMPDRLQFVRALQDGPVTAYLGHGFADWHGIEGIIEFFQYENWGAPGTWVSWTDAGILRGIERGTALALGMPYNAALDAAPTSGPCTGSPGSAEWKSFLTDLRAGNLADRNTHDHSWGVAEQTSTDFGSCQASNVHGQSPIGSTQQNWFNFSQAFRYVMQNEQDTINAFIPFCLLGGLPTVIACASGEGTDLVHAFTDVSSSSGVFYSSSLAWTVSVPDWPNLFLQLTCGCGITGGGETPPPLYTAWDIPGAGAFHSAMIRVNLGAPTNFVHPVTNSRAQDFAGGTAYLASNGTWAIYGAIRTDYNNLGGSGSVLGPPTSDEQDAPGGGRKTPSQGRVAAAPARSSWTHRRRAHTKCKAASTTAISQASVVRQGSSATPRVTRKPHRVAADA